MSEQELNSVTITYNAKEGATAAVRLNNDSPIPLENGSSVTVPVPAGGVVIFQEAGEGRAEDKAALDAHAQRVAEQEAEAAKAAEEAQRIRDADATAAQAAADAEAEKARIAAEAQAAAEETAKHDAEKTEASTDGAGEGEGEKTDEYVEGEVYDIAGVKSVYGKFGDEAGNETFGFLPLADNPAEVVSELLAAGKITQEEYDAAKGGVKPVTSGKKK